MAWHEAAHAVVRAVLEVPVESSRLWNDRDGTWSVTEPDLDTLAIAVAPERVLAVAVAGAAMEEALFAHADDHYHRHGSDRVAAAKLADALPNGHALLESAWHTARVLLRRHESAIEEIAELLLDHGAVTGDHVRHLVAATGGATD